MAATSNDELQNERTGRGALLADWTFANAAKQKFDLENAVLQRQFGAGGQFSTIPFGNTTVIQQSPASTAPAAKSLVGKLAPWLVGAAMGPAGLGIGLAADALLNGDSTPQLPVAPQAQPPESTPPSIEFPVDIQWHFNPEGGHVEPRDK